MVSCEKVRVTDRSADDDTFLEAKGHRRLSDLKPGGDTTFNLPPDSYKKAIVDSINHPPHYNNSQAKCECGRRIECIDVTRHLNFNIGNAIKYLWRCDLKGASVEDLRKAIWYIQDEITNRIKP